MRWVMVLVLVAPTATALPVAIYEPVGDSTFSVEAQDFEVDHVSVAWLGVDVAQYPNGSVAASGRILIEVWLERGPGAILAWQEVRALSAGTCRQQMLMLTQPGAAVRDDVEAPGAHWRAKEQEPRLLEFAAQRCMVAPDPSSGDWEISLPHWNTSLALEVVDRQDRVVNQVPTRPPIDAPRIVEWGPFGPEGGPGWDVQSAMASVPARSAVAASSMGLVEAALHPQWSITTRVSGTWTVQKAANGAQAAYLQSMASNPEPAESGPDLSDLSAAYEAWTGTSPATYGFSPMSSSRVGSAWVTGTDGTLQWNGTYAFWAHADPPTSWIGATENTDAMSPVPVQPSSLQPGLGAAGASIGLAFLAALASKLRGKAKRNAIERALADESMTVADLMRSTGVSRGAIRHHLDRLLSAGRVCEAPNIGESPAFRLAGDQPRMRVSSAAHEVLDSIRSGLSSTRTIAQALSKSPSTVAYHIRRLREARLVDGGQGGQPLRPVGKVGLGHDDEKPLR